jgi:Zn-dependent alcohol dehydrogenase
VTLHHPASRACGACARTRHAVSGWQTVDAELPQTMGHEAAGVVDELGQGVADVAVGDRVFGFSTGGWHRPVGCCGRRDS